MKSRFLEELRMRRPLLTGTISHRKFLESLNVLYALAGLLPPEKAVLLVGPSNVGKSLLLGYLVSKLLEDIFQAACEKTLPVIGFTALTSREGRTTPKFALHELLEDAGHPLFLAETLDGNDEVYHPKKTLDETFCLRALKSAILHRQTKVIIGDEAQYLVRAKNEEFRASLLETFKSLITPQTTLFFSGGYELAEVALSNRAHFASRCIVIHVDRYSDSREDLLEWRNIVATLSCSDRLRLEDPNVLTERADQLREECHGVVGTLEKRLVHMHALVTARGDSITSRVLDSTTPTDAEWNTIENDIRKGELLLESHRTGSQEGSAQGTQSLPSKQRKKTAFKRKPKRAMPDVLV